MRPSPASCRCWSYVPKSAESVWTPGFYRCARYIIDLPRQHGHVHHQGRNCKWRLFWIRLLSCYTRCHNQTAGEHVGIAPTNTPVTECNLPCTDARPNHTTVPKIQHGWVRIKHEKRRQSSPILGNRDIRCSFCGETSHITTVVKSNVTPAENLSTKRNSMRSRQRRSPTNTNSNVDTELKSCTGHETETVSLKIGLYQQYPFFYTKCDQFEIGSFKF